MRRRDPAAAIGAPPPQLRSPACPRNARHAARCSLVRRARTAAFAAARFGVCRPRGHTWMGIAPARLRADDADARAAPRARPEDAADAIRSAACIHEPLFLSLLAAPHCARTLWRRSHAVAPRSRAPARSTTPLAESRETLSANATFFGRVEYRMVTSKSTPAAGRSESACARLFPFFFF